MTTKTRFNEADIDYLFDYCRLDGRALDFADACCNSNTIDELDADELDADELEADEMEAAAELAALGIRANYAGMYSISVTLDGVVRSRVCDSASAALAEYRKSHADAA